MSIKKSFSGSVLRRPGAYSTTKVDNTAGSAILSDDTLFLVGESLEGAPGSVEGIQVFSAAQIDQLVAKYTSGPIVDCALAATRPSSDAGITGAGQILIWKTNATTQAALTVKEATNTSGLLVFKDQQWGVKGNDISVTIANGTTTSTQKTITINKLNQPAEVIGQNAGLAALSIRYTGNASTAAIAIAGSTKANKTLTTTLANDQSDGSLPLSIVLGSYSIKELVDFINMQTGYTATLITNIYAAKRANELDSVNSMSALTTKSLYRVQQEIVDLINTFSKRVVVALATTPVVGLPANVTAGFLTGGAQGASVNSDFSTGFSNSLAEDYNVLLPAICRDASVDIADAEGGFTNVSSTYTIASVLAAADAHLRLRGTVQNRKEAQGISAFRDALKANCYNQATSLSSELTQLVMQDVMVVDITGTLTWKQPHVLGALLAGIRLGTAVGEPLTHKRIAASGLGHFVDPVTGIASGDFNPNLDSDLAIDSGVTFCEKSGSIFRVVVDNTTYGVDDSFVFNRGSVMEAAQFIAKDIRQLAESVFVGQKTSNGIASSIKTVIRARLLEYNASDVNIITSSTDAPQGFVEKTFVVTVVGNTASVQLECKPVQGLDFVLISFTLGNIQQTA